MMTPLSSKAALDSFFFEARSKVLDLAAILDRVGRGDGSPEVVGGDPRMARLRQAIEALLEDGGAGARAERVQQIFSLEYDAGWERPTPRF